MPTTLTGLLLFVVLLLPGFVYQVGMERRVAARRTSVFRETVAVVVASTMTELVVLAAFAVVRIIWPSWTPDIGELVRNGGTYLEQHYALVAGWAAGLLFAAAGLASVATLPRFRKLAGIDDQHPSRISAWWYVFDKWHPEQMKHVGCLLADGSYIEGILASYDISADDLPDRDLILTPPIKYRAPEAEELHLRQVGSACVSARQIVVLFTSYLSPATSPSEEVAEAGRTESGA